MRIGVDATCWGNKRGFGRFTRELLESIIKLDTANEYLFFIDRATDDDETVPSRVKKIVAPTKVSPIEAASAEGRRSLKDLWTMSREVLRHKVDVFFFPTVYSYFPIFNRAKIIVTLHDIIADNHPDLIFPNAKSKFFWKVKQKAAIHQADIIATVSEYSKRQIIEYFSIPESRMRIISEAARPVFKILQADDAMRDALGRHKISPNDVFLLYVGGISPHKNLMTLINAFEYIAKFCDYSPIKLVLVGDYQDDPFFSAYPALKKRVSALKLDNQVVFTGFVSDEDLAYLYNAAATLVFPSLEEGFGLPAIEAMACGTPVIASNCGSLPEVIGTAGRFFDPHNTQNMAEVICGVLGDTSLRASMKTAGIARSKEFMWEKAARETVLIFNELAGQPTNVSPAPSIADSF